MNSVALRVLIVGRPTKPYGPRPRGRAGGKKVHTPCGTQTRNLQIRSLTRYSIAPTGLAAEQTQLTREPVTGECAVRGGKKKIYQVLPGLEPGSKDSESLVMTITLQDHACWIPRNVPVAASRQTRAKAKSDTFSICACHPCAGAMLIFSVSFQF